MTLRLGWFTTARGAGSRALYETVSEAIAGGALDAEMAVVFCNRDPGEDAVTDGFFDLVRSYGHPLVTRSSVAHRRAAGGPRSRSGEALPQWRAQYDGLIAGDLAAHAFDLGVMAGYMLIFTPEFVRDRPLLNLHPALPGGPAGAWREVIRALIRERAAWSGVMLHLATATVDAGPVVAYCRYTLHDPAFNSLRKEFAERIDGPGGLDDDALEASALFAAIRARGVRYESPLLLATVAEFAAGRLRAVDGRVLGRDGLPREPADLTQQVRARLGPAGSGGVRRDA